MSSNKYKRQLKRHRDQRAIRKSLKILRLYGYDKSIKNPGRFRKFKAMGCSNARCGLCSSPRILWGEATVQERRNLSYFQYSMREIDFHFH